jgi:hypothetical protein
MPDTAAALASKLETEGRKVVGFFSGLSQVQWQVPVYAEGEIWNARSILAHFVTAERGFLRLFANVRAGEGGVDQDFSIDRYNARQQERTKDLPAPDLLSQFSIVRSEMATYVGSLTDADLRARGRHPAIGEASLLDMIKVIYLHNNTHIRDIRKSLLAKAARS